MVGWGAENRCRHGHQHMLTESLSICCLVLMFTCVPCCATCNCCKECGGGGEECTSNLTVTSTRGGGSVRRERETERESEVLMCAKSHYE